MAVTKTLLVSINSASTFLKNLILKGVGGNPLEPALSIGDWTRNFILSAPFAWRWNRTTTTFNTVAGQQDYVKNLTNFGWLESATVNDNLGNTQSIKGLQVRLNESEDGSESTPMYISAQYDDNAGNITFRLIPVPDKAYTVVVTYQKASPNFTSLSDTWSPIPDYMSGVYNLFLRAFAYEYFDDPRFAVTFQQAIKQLLSYSEGLTETQRSIFLQDFLILARQQQEVGIKTQLALQNRSGH